MNTDIIKTIKNKSNIQVRYAETDKMGVVYNANYYIYFETGRTELVHKHNLYFTELEKEEKIFFPVLESYAKFHNPAYYEDNLEIETIINYNYSPIFHIEYNIYRNDILICSGYTKHIFISQITNKPIKPPKKFIALFE